MTIQIAVAKETVATERRVALIPNLVKKYQDLNMALTMERGAGELACYPDHVYHEINWADNARACFAEHHAIIKVQAPTLAELEDYPEGATVIGMLDPYRNHAIIEKMQTKNITSFALELLPRSTRAQAMDVLSSQASIAGYYATLLAASHLPRFFPMLTTAAGTIKPAQVLVIGAGVAGLQAIATAKRLGAIVSAYDIRPDAREQVESLGAKMVKFDVDASGEGGYARELTAAEKQQQQDLLAEHIAKAEVVITTAAIPGKKAPLIISKTMVENMQPGSVIVDIAAETGGNCECTKANETLYHQGITIIGPTNLASHLPRDASDMYARNVFNFLTLFVQEGEFNINWDDDIISASVLTHQGNITNAATQQLLQGVNS